MSHISSYYSYAGLLNQAVNFSKPKPASLSPRLWHFLGSETFASQVVWWLKNLPANAGDLGLIPGSGRSPGVGNDNPLQYSWKYHGQRSLAGRCSWDCKSLTQWLNHQNQNTVYCGLPWWLSGKESACQCRRHGSIPDQEDPTCHRTAKLVCHNYSACAPEPGNHNCWVHMPQLLKPMHPIAHAPQQEKLPQLELKSCN